MMTQTLSLCPHHFTNTIYFLFVLNIYEHSPEWCCIVQYLLLENLPPLPTPSKQQNYYSSILPFCWSLVLIPPPPRTMLKHTSCQAFFKGSSSWQGYPPSPAHMRSRQDAGLPSQNHSSIKYYAKLQKDKNTEDGMLCLILQKGCWQPPIKVVYLILCFYPFYDLGYILWCPVLKVFVL